MYSNAACSFGFPHSSYSATVSGSVASSIVFITSTNGTCDSTTRNSSGRIFTTAPISKPPALPPSIATRFGSPYPSRTRNSVASIKFVNVLRFSIILPPSCHGSPNSPPPRICAYAITSPRSSIASRDAPNPSGSAYPYDPYPYTYSGELPSFLNLSRRYTSDTGTSVPSLALNHSRSDAYREASNLPGTSCSFSSTDAPVRTSYANTEGGRTSDWYAYRYVPAAKSRFTSPSASYAGSGKRMSFEAPGSPSSLNANTRITGSPRSR